MQPSDPGPNSSARFLLGAALAFLFALGCVAFLNWWQNPFYAFRQVLPHLRERPPAAILGADRDRQMRWIIQQGNTAPASTLLIGPSQFLYGMDTCAYPQVKRLALFFMTDAEIAQMLRAAAPHLQETTTFYISRGIAMQQTPAPPLGRLHELWRDLLGQQASQTSLSNLYSSILPGPPPCASVPYTRVSQASLTPAVMKTTLALLPAHIASEADLEGILAAVEPTCARLHHRIVLVQMPVLFLPEDSGKLLALDERTVGQARRAAQSFQQRHTGCSVEVRDLAGPYILANQVHGPRKDLWFDTLHFKPALGQRFLEAILTGDTRGLKELGAE